MQAMIRQLLTMALGAVIMAAILMTARANAQDTPASSSEPEPMSVAGVAAANHYIQYQGQAYNPNTQQPIANSQIAAVFTLYLDPVGTQVAWVEGKTVTTNVDGLFNTNLGDTVPFDLNMFTGEDFYLGVTLNGEETRPLQHLGYVPYAAYAHNADKLDGIGSSEFARVIAYGFVDDDGGRESGAGDWDSDRETVDGERVYIISIDNVDYSFRNYTTIVTPACDRAIMVGTGSSDGALIVDVFDAGGFRTKCNFQFAVFRRP